MQLDELIDFNAAAKLKGFSFTLNAPVKGYRIGVHKSFLKGASPDFFEYQEYTPGDELKHLDWRVYGRLDKLYIKKFEDEVNLTWCVLIDRSGSMGYASGSVSKLMFAVRLSATLAYLLTKQGDAVALGDFSQKEVKIAAPKTSTSNLITALENLRTVRAEGKTGFKQPILRTLESIKRDSAYVIVSDFFTELESLEETVKILRSSRKEVFAFHVLDPYEISFPFGDTIEFEDLEDGVKITVDAASIRSIYKKNVEEFIERLKLIFQENGVKYVLCLTNQPIEELLIQIASR
ncbi:MAG: DUF58 domain-containing protein [Thermodesulfobacteriota bacterium]